MLLVLMSASAWAGITTQSWLWGLLCTACAVIVAVMSSSSWGLAQPAEESPLSDGLVVQPEHKPAAVRVDPDDPERLLTIILDALSEQGAVAVTLWAAHESTGTARSFSSVGAFASGGAFAPYSTTPVGRAISSRSTMTERISSISDGTHRGELWTLAVPLGAGDVTGAVSVDVIADHPDSDAVLSFVEQHAVDLTCAVTIHELKDREISTRSLLESVTEISRVLTLEDLLKNALDTALSFTDGETGSIMLVDDDSLLRIKASRGLPEHIVESTSVTSGDGIAGWVLSSGKPLLIEDAPHSRGTGVRRSVRSALSVPIADDSGIIGVLNVGSRALPAKFTERHMGDLELFATHFAVAWRNASAINAVERLMFDSLKTLALAMETKDPYTMGGTERLVEYASMLARALDLNPEEIRSVEIAALIHDVGMEAAGGVLVGRRAGLTTVEQGLIQMHPAVTAELLRDAPALANVAPIVYHHHERFDGTGYVEGIQGESIPLGSRILAVCDAYVAMTSPRPYRSAMDSARALRELSENAGTQFDPRIVHTFIDTMRSGSDRVPRFEG